MSAWLPAMLSVVPAVLIMWVVPAVLIMWEVTTVLVVWVVTTVLFTRTPLTLPATEAVPALPNSNSNALPEHFVEDVLLVVNQMTQKETFEALYRAMLFRHLVACQFGGCPSRVDHDVLLPEEMRIIDEIKAICGNVFVSRMDSLAKDSLASREFTAYLAAAARRRAAAAAVSVPRGVERWGCGGRVRRR